MTKFRKLIESFQEEHEITNDDKKSFLESIKKFHDYGKVIYREKALTEIIGEIKDIVEKAQEMMMTEDNSDWFDDLTLKKHSKHLTESLRVFERTANEVEKLQQRLEAAYDDVGSTLSKYFEISENIEKNKDEN